VKPKELNNRNNSKAVACLEEALVALVIPIALVVAVLAAALVEVSEEALATEVVTVKTGNLTSIFNTTNTSYTTPIKSRC